MQWVFRLIMNDVPYPRTLYASTLPPICSIIFLQIDSPSPVPDAFLLEFSSNLLKSMNSFSSPASEMPIPVSMMLSYSCTNLLSPFLMQSDSSSLSFLRLFIFFSK
jgi:hypothetical protein